MLWKPWVGLTHPWGGVTLSHKWVAERARESLPIVSYLGEDPVTLQLCCGHVSASTDAMSLLQWNLLRATGATGESWTGRRGKCAFPKPHEVSGRRASRVQGGGLKARTGWWIPSLSVTAFPRNASSMNCCYRLFAIRGRESVQYVAQGNFYEPFSYLRPSDLGTLHVALTALADGCFSLADKKSQARCKVKGTRPSAVCFLNNMLRAALFGSAVQWMCTARHLFVQQFFTASGCNVWQTTVGRILFYLRSQTTPGEDAWRPLGVRTNKDYTVTYIPAVYVQYLWFILYKLFTCDIYSTLQFPQDNVHMPDPLTTVKHGASNSSFLSNILFLLNDLVAK